MSFMSPKTPKVPEDPFAKDAAKRAAADRDALAEEEKSRKLAAMSGKRGSQALTSSIGFTGFPAQNTMGSGVSPVSNA